DGEGEPVTREPVAAVGAHGHVGRGVVGCGVHRVRPRERARSREAHVERLERGDRRGAHGRCRRRTMSRYTATMTMPPVTTVCHSCGTERIRRPFVSVLMMNAPMTVPRIEPSPPESDVPPITAAAIASSS